MALVTYDNIKKVWGSHIPLTNAAMEILKPESVIECGCGNFSTPILSAAKRHTVIEHNLEWANHCLNRWPDADYKLQPVFETGHNDASREELNQILDWYAEWAVTLDPVDLLFVDTVTKCRVPAFDMLAPQAEVIILHDTDPDSWQHYGFNALYTGGLHHYQLQPLGKVNGHKIEWTSLFSRKRLCLGDWEVKIKPPAAGLWGPDVPWKFVEIDND